METNTPYKSEKKVIAGIFAIFLGYFGIHKFYLGYNSEGLILLLGTLIILPAITLFTCGIGGFLYPVVFVIPLVEGIIYLTKTDEEFDQTYVYNKKPWL